MAQVLPDEHMMSYWMLFHAGEEADLPDFIDERFRLTSQTEPWARPNLFFLGPRLPNGSFIGVKVLKRQWLRRFMESSILDLTDKVKHLSHRNLVPILGCLVEAPREEVMIWQHHIDGLPLRATLRSRKRGLDDIPARCHLRFILEGLQHLHAHGVIHGKLSTLKVIIDRDGLPVITDYAFPISSLKPVYKQKFFGISAPEALDDGEIGPAADVWSFGMLCAELYTGVPAFQPTLATRERLSRPLPGVNDDDDDEDVELAVRVRRKLARERLMNPVAANEISSYVLVPSEAMEFLLPCLRKLPEERPSVGALLAHPFLNTGPVLNAVARLRRTAQNQGRARQEAAFELFMKTHDENEKEEEESEEEEEEEEESA